MYSPKTDIYNSLKALPATILQGSQATFNKTPAITFKVSDNSIQLNLDNQITSQSIVVIIDIWTDSSIEATELLDKTETIMRENNYRLSFSTDVPNPDGALHHINCRFETTR